MTTTERTSRRRAPSPISLRVTHEERETLEASAQGGQYLSVSDYIRSKLFGPTNTHQSKDDPAIRLSFAEKQKTLARILGKLGELKTLRNLSGLAEAARLGVLPATPDVTKDIRDACAAILDIRLKLFEALGLRPPGGHEDDIEG